MTATSMPRTQVVATGVMAMTRTGRGGRVVVGAVAVGGAVGAGGGRRRRRAGGGGGRRRCGLRRRRWPGTVGVAGRVPSGAGSGAGFARAHRRRRRDMTTTVPPAWARLARQAGRRGRARAAGSVPTAPRRTRPADRPPPGPARSDRPPGWRRPAAGPSPPAARPAACSAAAWSPPAAGGGGGHLRGWRSASRALGQARARRQRPRRGSGPGRRPPAPRSGSAVTKRVHDVLERGADVQVDRHVLEPGVKLVDLRSLTGHLLRGGRLGGAGGVRHAWTAGTADLLGRYVLVQSAERVADLWRGGAQYVELGGDVGLALTHRRCVGARCRRRRRRAPWLRADAAQPPRSDEGA